MTQSPKTSNQKNSDKEINSVAKADSLRTQIKHDVLIFEKNKSDQGQVKSNKPIKTNETVCKVSQWQPTTSNVISFMAVGVNLWLAIVTYKLYRLASGQFNSVKKAGDAAETSALMAKKTFDMTRQYNKEIHAPYLQVQIDKVTIHDTLRQPAMVVFLYYTIYNFTQTPVKIISKKRSHPVISPTVPLPTEERNMIVIPDVNNYVIKESPDSEHAYGHNVYTKQVFTDFRLGRQKLYMDEIIEYQNLVNGEKRKYKFRVQVTLTTDEVPFTVFLYNDNFDAE